MHNKIRIGRLLEDLDIFAVHLGESPVLDTHELFYPKLELHF
jgi:hypothetical protein